MSSRRIAVASTDDTAGAKYVGHAAAHTNDSDNDDVPDDDVTPPKASDASVRRYSVEQRSIAQNRAIAAGNQDLHATDDPHQQPTPPLDFGQLPGRRRSTIRRMSTRARRIDEAPDSLRLESTRRRASSVVKDPSRASVVYSPRALAEVLGRQAPPTRRATWDTFCSVM